MTTTCSYDIVIPVRGRHQEVAAVLEGLDRAAAAMSRRAPVLVRLVFDGDEEGYRLFSDHAPAMRLPLICHSIAPGGPSLARNCGALAGSAGVIAFLDSDVIPDPTYLDGLVSFFESHPQAAAVRGPVRAVPPRPSRWHRALVRGVFIANDGRERFYSSANLAWKREAFLQAGGFDPAIRMPSCEDLDLCWRWLLRDGGQIEFCPAMSVVHPTTKLSPAAAVREFRRKRYDALLLARFPAMYLRVYAYQWMQLGAVIAIAASLAGVAKFSIWAALGLCAAGLAYGFNRTGRGGPETRYSKGERIAATLALPVLPLAYAVNFVEGFLSLVALRPSNLFGRQGRWRRSQPGLPVPDGNAGLASAPLPPSAKP